MAEVCQAVAHGSLMGARGNSGVILSQVLRGLADTFRNLEAAGAADFADGMRQASDAAYEAVMRPVEGTILTVVRATAEAAEAARDAGEQALEGMLDAALAAAVDAVARTPELLPVLKEAGVVDAGGAGSRCCSTRSSRSSRADRSPSPRWSRRRSSVEAHLAGDDVASLRYEVMYLLEAEDSTIDGFKQTWAALGDSIVVVGGDGLWNCHVHTDDIGGAIEAGIEAGRPRQIRVTDLLEQVEEEQWVRDQDPELAGVAVDGREPVEPTEVDDRGRRGRRRRRHPAAAGEPRRAGDRRRGPVDEPVDRADPRGGRALPVGVGDRAAEQQEHRAGRAAGRRAHAERVEVIPTTSVLEALAALDGLRPAGRARRQRRRDERGRGRVATGEVTQAVRDSVAECGPIAAGDWLAIGRDGICATAANPVDAALALVAELITEDSEIVTVLVGVRRARCGHRARPRAGRAGALARGGRGARGRPAALPVPDRGGVATAPRTLRELAATPLGDVDGIAPKLLERLALMTPPIESVLDLLQHYPRRYHDRTRKAEIAELVAGEEATIVAEVKRVSSRQTRQRKKMVEAVVEDDTGLLNLVFFNQPWRERQLAVGTEVAAPSFPGAATSVPTASWRSRHGWLKKTRFSKPGLVLDHGLDHLLALPGLARRDRA